jgi:hypothetical protein
MGGLSSRCILEEMTLVPCKTRLVRVKLVPKLHDLDVFIYAWLQVTSSGYITTQHSNTS